MTRFARRVGFLFAVLALAAAPAGRAEAGTITTQAVDLDQQFLTPVDGLLFSFGAAPDINSTFLMTTAVDLGLLTIGVDVPIFARGDAGFESLTATLTDGADGIARLAFDPVGSGSEPVNVDEFESAFFTDPGLTGPDLGSVVLDRISLRVVSLSFEIDGDDGNLTNVLFTGELIFEDADVPNPVPAPPSAVLAGFAGIMVLARAVRRRRSA